MANTYVDSLLSALQVVMRGFDEGIFVRDISHDADPSWAVKLLPYVVALATLQKAVSK